MRVLIVDDSRADARMLEEMLQAEDGDVSVHWAPDGPEALDFLFRPETEKPDVILLDINMPKMSGHEVLSRIKSDPALSHRVVVMFSSSNSPEDVVEAYRHKANGFVKKPYQLERYEDIARSVARFWGRINRPVQS